MCIADAHFSLGADSPAQVHAWMLRHVYVDGMKIWGFNKAGAATATFLWSAVLHELVLIVAFKVH